ncbi:multiple epidermal growth factor-like domains protein 10 isoform X2 [Mizuhopecten yessoensis]|uniref:Multiple epidermal growth factor-like domains protein 10 n=1 Tax=Mizuhopecten yessoensis TaxID=6573 RepID=A0A210QHU3_MIZYE|nr:multiple epidermal growth factor-like domains protein 10 isoform X2 [Mizuhopecten yessoensis]OWF48358.1 Multiple epidermal growth factor-like domains protein 10 [Mizuhopecten yessoensis]
MSVQRRVLYLIILATYFVLDGLDASDDTTAKPGTTTSLQNTQMTSNGSTPPLQVNATSSSETETDLFLEPKNCTRTKMSTVTVKESFKAKCKTRQQTCSGAWFWKKCRQKDVYRSCDKYRSKTVTRLTTEPICCPGFVPYNDTAAFCVKGCETGKYGDNCTLDCNCTGNTRPDCDISTGDCKCKDGWTGQNCTDVCDEGFYGHSCENACACENNSTCEHVNGTCNCTEPGWIGDTCDTECLEGQYGYYCNQTCSCSPNATCDPHSGECRCIAGLTGDNCTEVCDDGYFGADCQQTCTCLANSTRACDPVHGTCDCIAGLTGQSCAEYCEPGTYGEMCRETCNCTLTEVCHPINGECISRFLCSVNGTANCDLGFGESDCTDIQGNTSLEPLQGNISDILNNPKDICDSDTNQTQFCVPSNETVLCECLAGWTGYSCEQLCPSGMYGSGCRYKCTCDDECDRVDGRCFGAGKSKEQKANQGTSNIGLVLGLVISSIVVICLIVVGVVVHKRKGCKTLRNVQVTIKKTRSTSERSYADNRTYELQQPEIIGSASRGPLMSEDRCYENGGFNEECAREEKSHSRKKATLPSKDTYSPVVKTDDGSYDNFENMRHNGVVDEMYTGQVIDGVYNNLDHRNSGNFNGVDTQDDEYSHVKIAASSDTYDVFKGKGDTTGGDNMYDCSHELSNTYDVFRKKGDTNVIADSMYDTNDSVAAGSQTNTKHNNSPD